MLVAIRSKSIPPGRLGLTKSGNNVNLTPRQRRFARVGLEPGEAVVLDRPSGVPVIIKPEEMKKEKDRRPDGWLAERSRGLVRSVLFDGSRHPIIDRCADLPDPKGHLDRLRTLMAEGRPSPDLARLTRVARELVDRLEKSRAVRAVADKAIVRKILRGRRGYTRSSLKRKGQFGKISNHHILPFSLRNHPVMKYLKGLNRDFHINARGNRILLRPQKVAGEKRGAHGKDFSMKHCGYNKMIQKRLDRIAKLPQRRWKEEVQTLQARLRKGFKEGRISFD
jgi:hypothetical protein